MFGNYPVSFANVYTNNSTSLANPATSDRFLNGIVVRSGAANTAGSWVQINAGLPMQCFFAKINLTNCVTAANVAAATNKNCYVDFGIGPDSGSVTTVIEGLGGSSPGGLGFIYSFPFNFPKNTPIWVRHQNTNAAANITVQLTTYGGLKHPEAYPKITRVVALGKSAASTTGTALTPSTAGAEGGWTQIVASAADDYAGFMVSPLFNVDTTLSSGLGGAIDVGVGPSTQEVVVGENLTTWYLYTGNEQRLAICNYTLIGVPAGSRICARAAGSGTADSTNSVVVYAFIH